MIKDFNPLVSIVIPVYNGSNYLAEAIDSALAQTYKNIEIIVVNDGSEDDGATEKVALSYGDKVRYFHKENGGISSTLNYGISKMNGDFFSWLSHDDLYERNKIKSEVNALTSPDDIILCSGSLIDENGKSIPNFTKTINARLTSPELFKQFIHGYVLNGLGFLVPKRVFEKVGVFDESMRYLQDLDMWLRMLMYPQTIVCLKQKLVITRIHRGQTTNLLAPIFNVDRTSLAKKHIEIIKCEDSIHNKKTLLLLYYKLFIKDNHLEGEELARNELKKLGNRRLFLSICSLPYRIYAVTIRLKRWTYNLYFKLNGVRE